MNGEKQDRLDNFQNRNRGRPAVSRCAWYNNDIYVKSSLYDDVERTTLLQVSIREGAASLPLNGLREYSGGELWGGNMADGMTDAVCLVLVTRARSPAVV